MSWTKQDQAKLREYQTAQMTVAEIAEKMDRPIEWIRTELEAMGYKPIESKPAPEPSEFLEGFEPVKITGKRSYNRMTPEKVKTLIELRAQGKTIIEAAKIIGVSKAAAENALRKVRTEANEKEPAPSANDASSEQVNCEVLPIINDNTPASVCQEPGINAAVMATLLLTMLDEAFGRECEPTGIKADRDHLDLSFSFEDREYYIVFGQARHYEYASGGERV